MPSLSPVSVSTEPRPRRRSLLARGIIVAACAALVWIAATALLFVWPPTDDPARADAVIVFGARSHDERLPAALALIRAGMADVLVASAPPAELRCGRKPGFDLVCFDPEPFTTRGEARATARLANARGWRRVLLVTSTWHATRASLLLERCTDAAVDVVGGGRGSREGLVRTLLHEWGGLAYAFTIERGC